MLFALSEGSGGRAGAVPAAIYLSPHLDDAVLSCGGQIFARAQRGEVVWVLSVFTADIAPGPLPALAAKVLEAMSLPRDQATARRREEDIRACDRLGAEALHWAFCEATLRRGADGVELYGSFDELFGDPRAEDDKLVEEVAQQLVACLEPFAESVQIVAPLAVGSHVDHHVVRRAAESAVGARLLYYEDYPYVRKLQALWRVVGLPWGRRRRRWLCQEVAVDQGALEAKLAAISAYESQLAPLFGSENRMRHQVCRRMRKLGGERLWSARRVGA